MSRYTIEKDWTTVAGFRAVVLMGSLGHRCGYVGVPPGHPLHGIEYSSPCAALQEVSDEEGIGQRGIIPLVIAACNPDRMLAPDVVFDVHGGITYSGEGDYPVPSDLWWFGFDCAHHGDAPDLGSRRYGDCGGVHRSLEYCEQQCESLAEQLIMRLRHVDTGVRS